MPISQEQFISEVDFIYDTYKPSPQVLGQLGDIDLTTVSAPSGMGKDSLIAESGVPRVLADTIRAPRVNNGQLEQNGVEYEFRGPNLDPVLADVQYGRYVQVGMGPGRNSFYGSRISNYPSTGPAVMDVMTTQVETMRELPFRSVEAVFVVAPSYEIWQQRLSKRGSFGAEEWQKRQTEAKRSMEDALDDERYVFILNDELSVASNALYRFATSRDQNYAHSITARNIANSIRIRL